jgi:hypothetical protein
MEVMQLGDTDDRPTIHFSILVIVVGAKRNRTPDLSHVIGALCH